MKIIFLESHSDLPGANELTKRPLEVSKRADLRAGSESPPILVTCPYHLSVCVELGLKVLDLP